MALDLFLYKMVKCRHKVYHKYYQQAVMIMYEKMFKLYKIHIWNQQISTTIAGFDLSSKSTNIRAKLTTLRYTFLGHNQILGSLV